LFAGEFLFPDSIIVPVSEAWHGMVRGGWEEVPETGFLDPTHPLFAPDRE
jgi:hypothetical protein